MWAVTNGQPLCTRLAASCSLAVQRAPQAARGHPAYGRHGPAWRRAQPCQQPRAAELQRPVLCGGGDTPAYIPGGGVACNRNGAMPSLLLIAATLNPPHSRWPMPPSIASSEPSCQRSAAATWASRSRARPKRCGGAMATQGASCARPPPSTRDACPRNPSARAGDDRCL